MRSKARALVWEYFAFGWRSILLAQLAMLTVSMLFYATESWEAGRRTNVVSRFDDAVLFNTLALTGLCFASFATLVSMQTRHRLYVLPISSWQWLAFKLPLAMGTAAAMYLVTAGFVNLFYNADWGLWGPALFFAATVSVIHAAIAIVPTRGLRLLTCPAAASMLLYWLAQRYDRLTSLNGIPTPDAESLSFATGNVVTGVDLAILISLMIAGYVISALALQRDRHGEQWLRWKNPFANFQQSAKAPRFLTATSAQFWVEWKEKGLVIPIGILTLVVGAFLLVITFGDGAPRTLFNVALATSSFVAFAAPAMLGLAMGCMDKFAINRPMGSFRATRPVTDAQLSGAILKAAATSILVSFLIVAAYLLGHVGLTAAAWGLPDVLPHRETIAALIMVFPAIIGIWTVTALFASAALTGRLAWMLCLFIGVVLWVVIGGFSELLPARYAKIVQTACTLLGAGAVLAVLPLTAWAFYTAVRRSLIEVNLAWIAAALWLVLVMIAIPLLSLESPLSPGPILLTASLLALPVAPLATAPLALSWNRHR